MNENIPYESTKPMYLVDDVDNKVFLREMVIETCKGLPVRKKIGIYIVKFHRED